MSFTARAVSGTGHQAARCLAHAAPLAWQETQQAHHARPRQLRKQVWPPIAPSATSPKPAVGTCAATAISIHGTAVPAATTHRGRAWEPAGRWPSLEMQQCIHSGARFRGGIRCSP